jgi:hypothetical protein
LTRDQFERGSISYMIRATLTRPTSIAATSTCDRRISLVETVDIGPMVPPNPTVISLEPISKRARKSTKQQIAKAKQKSDQASIDPSTPDTARPSGSPSIADSGSQRPVSEHGTSVQSPTTFGDGQSEASGESVASSSTGVSFRLGSASVTKSARDSQGALSTSSTANKTITASIELLKAGCLPGDNVSVRVSIQHTKFIKSMHGIIITLYRQGRIDSDPPLSLFTDVKGKAAQKIKHEEYYPKSKTGFGGLSLSSAGSSHVFRKDLSQVFAPIIIDPATLSTVVTASIRVPEDVFPTITGVPGQMINFRYHIEVIVDLGGKLAGQDKHVPRLGTLNGTFNPSGYPGRDLTSGANNLTAWGSSIVNTDNIRREKSVVACLFEVIVGTTDSARQRGRGNTTASQNTSAQQLQNPGPSPAENGENDPMAQVDDIMGRSLTGPSYPYHNTVQWPTEAQQAGESPYDYEYDGPEHDQEHHMHHEPPAFVQSVPPPEVPRLEDLSEKERVRRAEERLLPSQPPLTEGESSSQAIAPSAPADLHDDIYGVDDEAPHHPSTPLAGPAPPDYHPASARPVTVSAPSAPDLDDLLPHRAQVGSHVVEDKQELERRRLMAEASSPADFPEEDDNAGEGSSGAQHAPTAPVLTEEDEHAAYPGAMEHNDGLPKYER